jgi:ATP-binding cassette subfamily B protein
VIENGKIAEGGSHAELLKLRGHYYRLYTQQFRHQLEVAYGVVEEEVEKEEVISEAVAAD